MEEGMGSPGARYKCLQAAFLWELNLGPLEEQLSPPNHQAISPVPWLGLVAYTFIPQQVDRSLSSRTA
ncbi:hypothetical protein I79_020857 [Cricetulus griseus]|uniref:Uncharacterized protein n=1 Tax=Cricetulus griseus TaxID=10029 RepID=G3IB67_CRIGR|nr:hypothetical protein I79_020857 [Cricetulus griseus]